MQLTNIFCLPKDMMPTVYSHCDRKALGRLALASQYFYQSISSDLAVACRAFGLARDLFLLDKRVKLFSNGKKSYLTDQPPETAYIKKIAFAELFGDSSFDELFDSGIDALCDLADEVLHDQRLLDGATDIQKKLIERAKLRSKGDVFLKPVNCCVDGNIPEDPDGRRFGNYGFENEWQVCCRVKIISNKCANWSLHHGDMPVPKNFAIDEKLPVALFYGKKEGDAIYISLHEREFKLICRQQSYEYSGADFEKSMLTLLKISLLTARASVNSSQLNLEQQKAMLQQAFQEYAKSFG